MQRFYQLFLFVLNHRSMYSICQTTYSHDVRYYTCILIFFTPSQVKKVMSLWAHGNKLFMQHLPVHPHLLNPHTDTSHHMCWALAVAREPSSKHTAPPPRHPRTSVSGGDEIFPSFFFLIWVQLQKAGLLSKGFQFCDPHSSTALSLAANKQLSGCLSWALIKRRHSPVVQGWQPIVQAAGARVAPAHMQQEGQRWRVCKTPLLHKRLGVSVRLFCAIFLQRL